MSNNRLAGSRALALALCFGAACAGPAQAEILDAGDGRYVWTDMVTSVTGGCQPSPPTVICPLSGIEGVSGSRIRIVRLGIGGDADIQSGDHSFRLVGGGLDFDWTAGQSFAPAIYDLGVTPPATEIDAFPNARGFAYSGELDLLAAEGEALGVYWILRGDFDGRYTFATDLLGNDFFDANVFGSARPWIQFEWVSAIPEPQTGALLLAGLGLLGFAARRRS